MIQAVTENGLKHLLIKIYKESEKMGLHLNSKDNQPEPEQLKWPSTEKTLNVLRTSASWVQWLTKFRTAHLK